MRNRRSTLSLCQVALVAVLAACGTGSQSGGQPSPAQSMSDGMSQSSSTSSNHEMSSPDPSATASKPMRHGTSIVGADSAFGTILFDGTGQAIYLFDVETTSKPACYDACATAWPPVLTNGSPVAGAGVKPALLGTTKRTDGTVQVTYRGHPLYFYAHEGKHEVKCHDVFLNGGKWYAVQPDGKAVPGS